MVDGPGPHFLLVKSLILWYLVLQRPRISQSVFEGEYGVESDSEKFHLRIDFKSLAIQF